MGRPIDAGFLFLKDEEEEEEEEAEGWVYEAETAGAANTKVHISVMPNPVDAN